MVTLQTLTAKELTSGVQIIHATAPFPKGTNVMQIAADGGAGLLPTQAQLAIDAPNHDILEVTIAAPDGAGLSTFALVDQIPPTLSDAGLLGFTCNGTQLAKGGGIMCEFYNRSGTVAVTVDLGRSQPGETYHRQGGIRETIRRDQDLGAYGYLTWWVTIEATRDEIGIEWFWHNAALPERAHVVFDRVRITLPNGWAWTGAYVDQAHSGDLLVYSSQHVIPVRCIQPFYLHVYRSNETPNLRQVGWGVGSWAKGGYLPQGFKVPAFSNTKLSDDYTNEVSRLANFQPAPYAGSGTPVDRLWPMWWGQYGGVSGGDRIEYAAGVRHAQGELDGLHAARIMLRRNATRQWGLMFDENGDPIQPTEARFLDGGGNAQWDMFDFRFLAGKVGNFDWDTFHATAPSATSPYFTGIMGTGYTTPQNYPSGSNGWDPHDQQHLTRWIRMLETLTWLDNDPMARHLLKCNGRMAKMCYWDGTGAAAGRMTIPSPGGLGQAQGRDWAWSGQARLEEWCLSTPAERVEVEAWLKRFVDVNNAALMANGQTISTEFTKISDDPPLGDGNTGSGQFYASQQWEQTMLHGVLWGAANILTGADQATAASLCATIGNKMLDYAWDYDTTTDSPFANKANTGPIKSLPIRDRKPTPAAVPFVLPSEWAAAWDPGLPPNEAWGNANDRVSFDAFYCAIGIAACVRFGDINKARTMASYFARATSLTWTEVRQIMEAWGPFSTSKQFGSPLEWWGPLLAEIQDGLG